jgi:hypothetical protein
VCINHGFCTAKTTNHINGLHGADIRCDNVSYPEADYLIEF